MEPVLVDENGYIVDSPILTTVIPGQNLSSVDQEQLRRYNASLVFFYGAPKDEKASLRFIVGSNEYNKIPGTGPNEINKMKLGRNVGDIDKSKAANLNRKDFGKLIDFSKTYNWRHILADDFQGDYKFKDTMDFVLDGHQWKTVIHYLLAMLYSLTPEYAIKYAVDSKDSDGLWGDVKTALKEHQKIMEEKIYPIDPEFYLKVKDYLSKAYFAKFTQNKEAGIALLLTDNAIISKRGPPNTKDILDVDVYDMVRTWIRTNPTIKFKGIDVDTGQPIFEAKDEIEIISIDNIAASPENLNILNQVNIPFKLSALKDINLDSLEVAEQDCIVYLAVGSYNIDLDYLNTTYGSPVYVKRNIYGLKVFKQYVQERICLAVQKNAVSVESEYILYNGKFQRGKDGLSLNFSLYLQKFQPDIANNENNSYGIFIVSGVADNLILDLLRTLIGIQIKITEAVDENDES